MIVTVFAWAYVRYGSIPEVKGVLYGVKPVIIAIVLQALWSLGRAAIKTKFLALIGIAGVILTFLGLHELLVLLGGGLIVVAVRVTGRAIKAVATVGIFLPAFVFVAASGPLVPRIRESPTAGAFLDGVNAAALALMVVVTYQLGRAAIVDITIVALALISGIILLCFRLNSAWVVLGGGIAGFLLYGRLTT